MANKRYAKANNPRAVDYNPSKPNKFITYLEQLVRLGHEPAAVKGRIQVEASDAHRTANHEAERKLEEGWIMEVDLEYPEELHESHNSYPLAPEKKAIGVEKMSNYQQRTMEDLALDFPKSEKLVLTLEDKEKYVVHDRNLQFYLKQGTRLKKVHRVLEFDQEPWMEPYIRMNTELRKQPKSETNFYKPMNNSVFGNTMKNLRKRVDLKIVRSWETDKIRLVASPSYARHEVFGKTWREYTCTERGCFWTSRSTRA